MSVAQGTPPDLPGYCARTFTLMPVGFTSQRSVQVSGFADIGLLTPLRRLYPLPVRQASALPSASSRFAVARDTLAVQLTLLLAECVEDFHLQVRAPCRAHQKKGDAAVAAAPHLSFYLRDLRRQTLAGRCVPLRWAAPAGSGRSPDHRRSCSTFCLSGFGKLRLRRPRCRHAALSNTNGAKRTPAPCHCQSGARRGLSAGRQAKTRASHSVASAACTRQPVDNAASS